MCGRDTLKTPTAELDDHFGVELPELRRHNIAPSQPVPAITADAVEALMPADGFSEGAPGPPKVPHHFRLGDGGPFAFAGLWDSWRDEPETCALITTTANEAVAVADSRMPVILHREDDQAWLDPEATPDALMGFLNPLPPGLMVGYPVGQSVHSPRYDGPVCVAPA